MRNKIEQEYYLYFMLENSKVNFLYSVRKCKKPEITKEYKKLKSLMNSGKVYSIGWCKNEYYIDNFSNFVDSILAYNLIN